MKKFLSFVLAALLLFSAVPAYASDVDSVTVKYLENGCYIVTIIEDVSSNVIQPMSTTTTSKSKNALPTACW